MSKSFYFFVYYPRYEKEKENDVEFVEPKEKEQKPECIFSLEEFENGIFYYKKIFKVTPKETKGKKSTSCYYVFEIGEEEYDISFKKNSTFIFDVNLKVGKAAIPIRREISQTIIKYIDKLNYFIEALKENGEEEKTDELYKDAISLNSSLKQFSFMISLFLKIYQKKDLCSELINNFKEMNNDPKQSDKNIDREAYLKDYTSKFNDIISESDKLVSDNKYDPIAFYGVMLCYLNYYDYKNFISLMNDLFEKKSEHLYEILLIYNKHLINPLNQNFEFFNKFISHSIKNKNFDTFKVGLSYIKDIEIFIEIIEKNKESIFNTYIKAEPDAEKKKKKYVELGKNLKFIRAEKTEEYGDEFEEEEKEKEKEEIPPSTDTLFSNISQTKEPERIKGHSNKAKSFKNIKEDNLHINKEKKEKEKAFKTIGAIKDIISFCKKNGIFLVHFTNDFWQYILYYFKEPTQNNIQICFGIREAFINYYNLVIKTFTKKVSNIKKEAQTCFDNDEFAFLLDDIIKRYIISYKKRDKKCEKKRTQDYMDSCLLFIYGKEYKDNLITFSKELKKLEQQQLNLDTIEKAIEKNKNVFLSELGNVEVFSSDICGLGKSGKIRKLIEDKKLKKFHFPLGGILSKKIIFDKLENLLNKIKLENYKDVAVHLDLTESREKSIMNEFLFSFLITKFYSNNENIIYIPNDIHIYAEIPNCFEDYLSKFNLLKIFKRDNITFETMPGYNYPKEIIEIFKRMLGIDSNEKIKEFVEKYIGIARPQPYSFHQINIFIKLFISQYNQFESKLQFLRGEKDVTEECISEFAKCTQYFTNGSFAKLIAGIDKNSNKDYIDELSEIYENDLKKLKFKSLSNFYN